MSIKNTNTGKKITRAKAIRLKCLDCCCGNSAEVRRCPASDCPLFVYRMGREIKVVSEDAGNAIDEKIDAKCEDSDGRRQDGIY